ncbi:DUF1405 domain-containing protein [Halobacteriales archaeon QS_1_68_20]|nr:MAG: DUF1405 domain-containing protein [Halobacteriales archaeon QS_1_68_20]
MSATLGRLTDGDGLPPREGLPRYVAPMPAWLENLGLRFAWVVVVVNLLGTAFGFWYYGLHPFEAGGPITGQLAVEPVVAWSFVPDSPLATLFFALALAAWKRGHQREWLTALAFFGCIKTGFWTPYVLLAFKSDFSYLHPAMYNFLFWSHLAMVLQALVLHRIADFSVAGVAVGVLWHGTNDLVDYFVPVTGTPHHTFVPAEEFVDGAPLHGAGEAVLLGAGPHELAAAGAVSLTVLATFLALSTRVEKLKRRERSR